MPRKDKILDVLALSFLSEDARIARLAHNYIGKPFPFAQARAVIDCYFEVGGRRAQILAHRLYDEKLRQERLHNDRAALQSAAELRAKSPMLRYNPRIVGSQTATMNRRNRRRKTAERIFGQYVRENFNEDTLALMSLLNGDVRKYSVKWLEGSSQPVPSALIKVTTQIIGGTVHERTFLLYKAGGRALVARVPGRINTIPDAFACQLPRELVEAAPTLMADGYTFQSDLEDQQMLVTSPDGLEKIVHWSGRTVDE